LKRSGGEKVVELKFHNLALELGQNFIDLVLTGQITKALVIVRKFWIRNITYTQTQLPYNFTHINGKNTECFSLKKN